MDQAEFRSFYDCTSGGLRSYLLRISGDEELTEDLAQEAYVRFLRAAGRPSERDARRAYLFRIATNAHRDAVRRARGPERRMLDELRARAGGSAGSARHGGAADVASAGGPTGGMPRAPREASPRVAEPELLIEVERALAELRPRDRQMLWLAHVEGMPQKEVARVVGVGAASVRPLLYRARRRLAELLTARGVGPEDLR